jgi:hypothetical protein
MSNTTTTTTSPEDYYQQVQRIENNIKNTTKTNDTTNNYKYFTDLQLIQKQLLNILNTMDDNMNTPIQHKLYKDYSDLYSTSYFTNISFILGIGLIIRYIMYYMN